MDGCPDDRAQGEIPKYCLTAYWMFNIIQSVLTFPFKGMKLWLI